VGTGLLRAAGSRNGIAAIGVGLRRFWQQFLAGGDPEKLALLRQKLRAAIEQSPPFFRLFATCGLGSLGPFAASAWQSRVRNSFANRGGGLNEPGAKISLSSSRRWTLNRAGRLTERPPRSNQPTFSDRCPHEFSSVSLFRDSCVATKTLSDASRCFAKALK